MTPAIRKIIVGLTGQFGAGCSTVADYVQEEGFRYYSLLNLVRGSARERLGGIPYQSLNPIDFREALQDEGNRLREADPSFNAKQVFRQIKADRNHDKDVVIDSKQSL